MTDFSAEARATLIAVLDEWGIARSNPEGSVTPLTDLIITQNEDDSWDVKHREDQD